MSETEIVQGRRLQGNERVVWKRSKASTASYATHSLTMPISPYNNVLIWLKETGGAQSVFIKIDASQDASNWENLKAETSIAASGSLFETLTNAWNFVRVQIKNNSGSGTILMVVTAKR